jgi:hypothetical protein
MGSANTPGKCQEPIIVPNKVQGQVGAVTRELAGLSFVFAVAQDLVEVLRREGKRKRHQNRRNDSTQPLAKVWPRVDKTERNYE